MALRIQCVTIDAHDPRTLAAFWAQTLSWRVTDDSAEEVVIEPAEGDGDPRIPDLLFIRVADDKAAKNRLHFDLRPEDQAAEVARLEGMGARRVDIGQGEVSWVVMADPEGNEFCVLRALTPEEAAQ
jgi:predicted enzyme related to lactoylglutathione lyase